MLAAAAPSLAPTTAAPAPAPAQPTAPAATDPAERGDGEAEPSEPRVVVTHTSLFVLTTAVSLHDEAADQRHDVLTWSECLTVPDAQGCCYQWLTACTQDETSCGYHVVHGCYSESEETYVVRD